MARVAGNTMNLKCNINSSDSYKAGESSCGQYQLTVEGIIAVLLLCTSRFKTDPVIGHAVIDTTCHTWLAHYSESVVSYTL